MSAGAVAVGVATDVHPLQLHVLHGVGYGV